jgi:predicted DNA binding CopG/RHH family protein
MSDYDSEEMEILAAFEAGRLRSRTLSEEALAAHRGYARNTLSKDRRISIRLSSKDLAGLQVKAIEEGIPYQTLVASILHKYVSGRLVERAGA